MRECFVSFASAGDVREFVEIVTRQPFSIRVENDRLQTDGESIMSLFCMGLHRPLRVLYPEDADTAQFLQALRPFLLS